MMRRIHSIPFQRKLVLLMLLNAGAVLIASGAAFIVNEFIVTKRGILDDLSTTAKVIAYHSRAAVAFGDHDAARESLEALRSKPWTIAGYIFDKDADLAASFLQDRAAGLTIDATVRELATSTGVQQRLVGPYVYHVQPLVLDNQKIGTVCLIHDLHQLRPLLIRYLIIALAILAFALGLSLALSSRLQHIISRPLLLIAQTMNEITRTGNYALRAPQLGSDEVGLLASRLNRMLTHMERITVELEGNSEKLEQQVALRTVELVKAKERAEEASRTESQFLANMSHEVRTPINGIVGMLQLMKATELSIKQRRYLGTALTAADVLMAVVDDVLDFSKMEAGKLDMESQSFHLRHTVEDAVAVFTQKAETKGLELVCNVDPALPTLLLGDRHRLGQVVMNLVGNAVKFTDHGHVLVHVELRGTSGDEVQLRFSVTDTGIGISREQKDRLFLPFSQADASMTRKYGGTGLGLAICRQVVTLMGGTIGVDSEPGKGSTFWFDVGMIRSREARPTERRPACDLNGVRVMVVDDSLASCQVIRDYATHWGCRVTTVQDGQTALAELEKAVDDQHPFDLAVLDARMPGFNGHQLATRIKTEDRLKKTTLLYVVSESDIADQTDLARLFARILVKPVSQSELYDALVTALTDRSDTPYTLVKEPARGAAPHGPMARILVAEDNAINSAVAREMIETLGLECDCVNNGKEAVAAVKTGRYQTVLMDCQMPEMHGYDATAAIREWEKLSRDGAKRIPIIALTAHAMKGDRDKCLAAGMDDYAVKPLSLSTLRQMIQKWHPAGPTGPTVEGTPERQAPPDAVLDYDRLLDQCNGHEAFAHELLDFFLAQSNEEISAIRRAITDNDAPGLEATAHRFKGGALSLHARRISAVALAIEEHARQANLAAAAPLADRLTGELNTLKGDIAKIRSRKTWHEDSHGR